MRTYRSSYLHFLLCINAGGCVWGYVTLGYKFGGYGIRKVVMFFKKTPNPKHSLVHFATF